MSAALGQDVITIASDPKAARADPAKELARFSPVLDAVERADAAAPIVIDIGAGEVVPSRRPRLSMKSESFRAIASIAIDEGSRERRATAQRLASQFETDADEFDLRSLERLGQEGLAAFLSSIGHQNPFSNRRGAHSARSVFGRS